MADFKGMFDRIPMKKSEQAVSRRMGVLAPKTNSITEGIYQSLVPSGVEIGFKVGDKVRLMDGMGHGFDKEVWEVIQVIDENNFMVKRGKNVQKTEIDYMDKVRSSEQRTPGFFEASMISG